MKKLLAILIMVSFCSVGYSAEKVRRTVDMDSKYNRTQVKQAALLINNYLSEFGEYWHELSPTAKRTILQNNVLLRRIIRNLKITLEQFNAE